MKIFLPKLKVYHVIYQLKLQNHVYYTFKCVLRAVLRHGVGKVAQFCPTAMNEVPK